MIRHIHRFSAAALGFLLIGSILSCELTVARTTSNQVVVTDQDRHVLARRVLTQALASPDAAARYGDRCSASSSPRDLPCIVYLADSNLPGLVPPTIRGFRFVSISVDYLANRSTPIKYLVVGRFEPYCDGVLVSLATCRKNGLIGAATVSTYLFRRTGSRWEGELLIWPIPVPGGGPGNVAQLAHAAERAQRERSFALDAVARAR